MRKEVNDGVEPDCIIQWRKKQTERIAIKDKEEEEKMREMRDKAKKDLEDWYFSPFSIFTEPHSF